MSTREHQKRMINRLRGSLIASSIVGALGIAGYLGISVPTATATNSTGSGTSTDTSTDSSSDSSSYFGDSTGISSGSGTSHAATSGS